MGRVFFKVFMDPNRVPRIRENYHRVPRESEKIGSLESETSGPYRSIPNILLKKTVYGCHSSRTSRSW